MADEQDPAALFFPDGEVDLYDVLGLSQADAPSDEAIRKAYRKKALQYHPDKAAPRGDTDPNVVFQQIGFAYSVLSDPRRRKRYDATGSTRDSVFDAEDVDWTDYFKTLWDGEVNGTTLDEYKATYQEEKADILEAYTKSKGDLATIFEAVPCSNILDDEQRFIQIINRAIAAGEVPKTAAWSTWISREGKRARKALHAKANTEADEAAAYAKEMGIYDRIYARPPKKTHGPPTAQPEDAVDLDALRTAMRAKASSRANAFDAMIGRLEGQSASKPSNHKKARKARSGHTPPTP